MEGTSPLVLVITTEFEMGLYKTIFLVYSSLLTMHGLLFIFGLEQAYPPLLSKPAELTAAARDLATFLGIAHIALGGFFCTAAQFDRNGSFAKVAFLFSLMSAGYQAYGASLGLYSDMVYYHIAFEAIFFMLFGFLISRSGGGAKPKKD